MQFRIAEEIRRLRESPIEVEQLIIIRKISEFGREVVYPLLEIARDGQRTIIEEIGDVLGTMNEDISDILAQEIFNPNNFVRWAVVLAIDKKNLKNFIPDLITAIGLGYDPVVEVIAHILHKMKPSQFKSEKFPEILNECTNGQKKDILKKAVKQLGVQAFDTTETLFALKTIQNLELDEAIFPVLKVLHHPDYRVREEAEKVLLQSFSKSKIYEICERIIIGALSFDLEQYNFKLTDGLDRTPEYYAFQGLSIINTRKAIKFLQHQLDTGTQENITAILEAMAKIHRNQQQNQQQFNITPNIKYRLVRYIETLQPDFKAQVVQNLSELGNEWILPVLEQLMNDTNSTIRMAVISALNRKPAESFFMKAAKLLIDEDARIRRAVMQLFWKVKPEFYGLHEGDIIHRLDEPLRGEILNLLCKKMRHASEQYKVFAIFWLGVLRHEEAFPQFLDILKWGSPTLKYRVIGALGIFGDRRAIPYLEPFIWNEDYPELQKKAIESMGSLGLDGLQTLIHQLFRKKDTNPKFLEKYIQTYGGRVLEYLQKEIEKEKSPKRKLLLKRFYEECEERHQVQDDQSNIFLL